MKRVESWRIEILQLVLAASDMRVGAAKRRDYKQVRKPGATQKLREIFLLR